MQEQTQPGFPRKCGASASRKGHFQGNRTFRPGVQHLQMVCARTERNPRVSFRNFVSLWRKFALFLLLLTTPVAGWPQLAPAPDAPPQGPISSRPGGSPDSENAAQTFTFHLVTNLVNLYFVVRDGNGRLVPDLAAGDCTVDEDNVRQTIKNFTARNDQPLTLGILLDTSLSQARVLPTEQKAGSAFLHRVLRARDEAFLFSFDVDVTMLSDFTNHAADLSGAIEAAQINSNTGNYANNTIPSIGKPRGTLLYDAVFLAATDKLTHEAGRKALILLTDGEDEGSQKSLDEAIEAAQKADAIVYVLLVRDSGFAMDNPGASPMRRLAQATGGQVFPIGGDAKKMQAAFSEIENELRSQYQASYTPLNSARDGSYRHIHVACRQNGKDLHVQARQGYYALPD